jgi:cystathionine gamma-synthase
MKDSKRPRPETIAARADGFICADTGAVVPPIHPSTTYARDADYEKVDGRGYSRDDNPTYDSVEAVIAELENAVGAKLFPSGMSAIATLFQALPAGSRVVVSDHLYFGTPKWLNGWAAQWGLRVEYVDTSDPNALRAAVQAAPTALVFVETPANPVWSVTDIAGAAETAHAAGALLAVDNTVATPVLTRPLDLGADLVVHSATKFLNGHSDVVAGVVASRQDSAIWQRIGELRFLAGAVLGPFEAWLLLRGLRTLFVRVERASRTAMHLAEHFARHRAIAQVCYPGLPGFSGYRVACRQMSGGFSGMLSLRLAGGAAAALATAKRAKMFVRATSLGGVESLIEHRHTIEGPDSTTPDDLLRLSIGLEAPEDLIADLEQALDG